MVEAAVTDLTCGRELLGETLTSVGGAVMVNDLTVAMPDCDATGDILVLKNLVPDMKIASELKVRRSWMGLKSRCAAIFAALSFCWGAWAQDVTLSALDGGITLDGTLAGL